MEKLFEFATALIAIPAIVIVIFLFVLMKQAHLISLFLSLVIVCVGFCVRTSVYALTGFFRSIPRQLLGAAKVDYANHLQIILHAIMLFTTSPLVTLSMVNGLWAWNALLISLVFLQGVASTTSMAGLAPGIRRDVRDLPLIMAGSFLARIPLLFFISFLGAYSRQGI